MEFDDHFFQILTKLMLSLIIGTLIGAEREYRNKSAGLRTMILICIGSTIFTIISMEASHETEIGRIASNIVTGIGFLGAGAIMRDGMSISGLTTASTIWVVASLGMAVGAGEFQLAFTAAILTLVVLVLFNFFQRILDRFRKILDLHVVFGINLNGAPDFEKKMTEMGIEFEKIKELRTGENVKYQYELAGKSKKLQDLIQYLVDQKTKVKSFQY